MKVLLLVAQLASSTTLISPGTTNTNQCVLIDGTLVPCPPSWGERWRATTFSMNAKKPIKYARFETPIEFAAKICAHHSPYSHYDKDRAIIMDYPHEWRDCYKVDAKIAEKKRAEEAEAARTEQRMEAPEKTFVTAVAQGRIK